MKKIISTLLACMIFATPAWAMTLDEAKQKGFLGEQPNGYLGLVKDNAEAKTLMNDINAKRKATYQKLATKNKITLADVAKIAGEKAMKKTKSGNYIKGADGQWKKK
ncbi:YdbL family protein [Algicola sagamiensis]|uniref:YdbL family protein n=1 Tax=Algicola sagamiensis TaxID=163869 RepID=UPI0003A3C771|nr:YdbL family protein [Algicola sagamiensis]